MGPGEVLSTFVAIIMPTILLIYVFRRFFAFKEKQLEVHPRAMQIEG
jgi:hypothetical protein